MKCIICGQDSWRTVHTGKTRKSIKKNLYACTTEVHGSFDRIIKCRSCGLIRIDPFPNPEQIAQAYLDVEDEQYLSHERYREIAFKKLLHRLQPHLPSSGKLLDAGCYTGVFLDTAQKHGYDISGLEPSSWAAGLARRRLAQTDIEQTNISSSRYHQAPYDIITSWDVLEHLTDPLADLKTLNRALKPGGTLALSTMRSDALWVKILGKRWPWFMAMHLYYFTPRTVTHLLKEAGFTVTKILPYPHYVSLDYLIWKALSAANLGWNWPRKTAQALKLGGKTIKTDFGDFMLVIAKKGKHQ